MGFKEQQHLLSQIASVDKDRQLLYMASILQATLDITIYEVAQLKETNDRQAKQIRHLIEIAPE